MVSIILSGMPASGKSTVGAEISKRLGIKLLVGGEILKEYAKSLGYNADLQNWWDTEEGLEFLKKRKEDYSFDRKLDEFLIRSINENEVVVTSWTLPWLVDDYHVKVWLKASFEVRLRRLMERDGLKEDEAREVLRKRDSENTEHYRSLYGFTLGQNLEKFNLVIDTDKIDVETIVNIIVEYYLDFRRNIERAGMAGKQNSRAV